MDLWFGVFVVVLREIGEVSLIGLVGGSRLPSVRNLRRWAELVVGVWVVEGVLFGFLGVEKRDIYEVSLLEIGSLRSRDTYCEVR